MPIRINLFSEAQAIEESRRRDPAKRAIIGGALLVALLLVWSSSIMLKSMLANSRLSSVLADTQSHTNEYQQVLLNAQRITATRDKITALQKLSNCRFLQGNLLNALQQSTLEGVQLVRVRVEQSYAATAATKTDTSGDHPIPGRPATATEKIVLWIDARDSSSNPGDLVNKFKDVISHNPYFQASLDKTNAVRLANLSPQQMGPDGKPCVLFTVECHYPDQTR